MDHPGGEATAGREVSAGLDFFNFQIGDGGGVSENE